MKGHWNVLATGMVLQLLVSLMLRPGSLGTLREETVAVQDPSRTEMDVEKYAGHDALSPCYPLTFFLTLGQWMKYPLGFEEPTAMELMAKGRRKDLLQIESEQYLSDIICTWPLKVQGVIENAQPIWFI